MKNNQEDKDFSYEVKIISRSSFLTRCYLSSERKKLIGEAYFYKNPEGIWKARVDVKNDDRFRNRGIGTKLLEIGDDYIRKNYPDSIREFEKLSDFGDTYLNKIPDANLIGIERNRYRFRL